MSRADFLLELLCEEIPARMQAGARNDLARMFAEELDRAGLASESIDVFSTPRRLALIARGLPLETEARSEEIKGPRSSAPEQAVQGFLRKTGLKRDQLVERDGVLFARVETKGQPTRELLGEMVERIVRAFPWPKSMRWGEASASQSSLRWVRPLHGIVAMLGEDIVPVAIDGIASGATTFGHRFHHPGPITVGGASDYAEKLRACHVIVDQEERERIIREGAARAAKAAGLALVEDEGLVVENAGLTEWPVPLLGRFDPDYLDVPREVIVLTMRANQKYFACTVPPRDGEGDHAEHGGGGGVRAKNPLRQPLAATSPSGGGLAPAFVCIANIDAKDGGASIVEGNRRVLAARLADARFFWEQDLKVPLEEQAKKLSGIVFHEKLGTVADKVERVAKLARWLVEEGIVGTLSPTGRGQGEGARPSRKSGAVDPPHPDLLPTGEKGQLADLAERAARLAKADLVTGMVGEFPELQGVICGYLAEAQGEPKAVAEAIRDHYKPVGQGDDVPTAPVTVAVALADKLDTLVSFFSIGEKPTGSKDPFALRRAALGILDLAVENDLRISIRHSIAEAYRHLVAAVVSSNYVCDWDVESDSHQRITESNFKAFTGRIAVLSRQPTDWTPGEWPEETYTVGANVDEIVRYIVDDFSSVVEKTSDYLFDRLEERQRREGKRYDLVGAVLPKIVKDFANVSLLSGQTISTMKIRFHNYSIDDDPIRLLARVKALQEFVETEDGADLLTAYKRAANILKKEKWESPLPLRGGDGGGGSPPAQSSPPPHPNPSPQGEGLEAEEAALVKALDKAEPKASAAVEKEDFTAAMAALASLRKPIDAFFDHVTVNDADKDKRARRLDLLLRFRDAVHRVADFSKIEG